MKKIIAVILSAIMIFGITSVASSAYGIETYEVIFTEQDFPFGGDYSLYNYRQDYVGKYMGYEYGVDYWYTVTNMDGTTTDIKGIPYSVTVFEGDPLEFTISVADYVDHTTVRALAFPTGTPASELYDEVTGEPDSNFQIKKSAANTYAVRPTQDMTVCVSEFHLFNDCFNCKFPTSKYYTTNRVQYDDTGNDPWEKYTGFEWGNTKVVYENETMFFEVRIPIEPDHTYHYDTYQVYYTTGSGKDTVTTYLKTSEQNYSNNVNCVAHYETSQMPQDELEPMKEEWVDVYKIDNVDPTVQIKVVGTVTYTMSMLREFFQDFDLEELADFDWDSVDFSPIVEYITRILVLIMKILAGFGLNIGG